MPDSNLYRWANSDASNSPKKQLPLIYWANGVTLDAVFPQDGVDWEKYPRAREAVSNWQSRLDDLQYGKARLYATSGDVAQANPGDENQSGTDSFPVFGGDNFPKVHGASSTLIDRKTAMDVQREASSFEQDEKAIAAHKADDPRKTGDWLKWIPSARRTVDENLNIAMIDARLRGGDPAMWVAKRWPWVRVIPEVTENWNVRNAEERIRNRDNAYTSPENKPTDDDYKTYARYLAQQERDARRSWGRKIFDGVTSLPAYAVEFATTTPVFKAGQSAGAAAVRALPEAMSVGRGGAATAGFLAGGLSQLAVNPQIPAMEFSRRMIGQPGATQDALGNIQYSIANGSKGEDAPSALFNAFVYGATEIMTEYAGGILKKIPWPARLSAFRAAIAGKWLQGGKGRTIANLSNKLMERTAWNGVLGEWFEDQLASTIESGAGLQNWNQAVPTKQEEIWPWIMDQAATMATYMAPGAALLGATHIQDKLDARRIVKPEAAQVIWAMSPDVAHLISKMDAPTRSDFERVGMGNMRLSQAQRNEVVSNIRKAAADAEKAQEIAQTDPLGAASNARRTFVDTSPVTSPIETASGVQLQMDGMYSGLPLPPQPKLRTGKDRIGGESQESPYPDQAVEQVYSGNANVASTLTLEQTKKIAKVWLKKLAVADEYLPLGKEWAPARDFFRIVKSLRQYAATEAHKTVAYITDTLEGPNQFDVFQRRVIFGDALKGWDAGQLLGFPFKDRGELERYIAALDEKIAKTPQIQEAMQRRQQKVAEIVQHLVDYKLLPKETLDNVDEYYHRKVQEYATAGNGMPRGTSPRPMRRGFQRARQERDEAEGTTETPAYTPYVTNYLTAESAWMTDAIHELEKARELAALKRVYDRKPVLVDEAAKKNIQYESEGSDTRVTWQDMLQSHTELDVWQPKPGHAFYKAFGIDAKIAESLMADALDSVLLTKDQLHMVLAMGGLREQYVLPKELVQQLDAQHKGATSTYWSSILGIPKSWLLFKPNSVFGYNLRNMTGDLDPVIWANTGILQEAVTSTPELYRGFMGQANLPEELRLAQRYAAADSGWYAEEAPTLEDLAALKRFFTGTPLTAKRLAGLIKKGYWDNVKSLSQFRENILRYAAFKYYYKQFKENKIPEHMAGSKRADVIELLNTYGPARAAAKVARDQLGDYGNISVFGQWFRTRLFPFWSWQEVNAKRAYRFAINAHEASVLRSKDAKWMYPVYMAWYLGRMASMRAAIWTFNMTFFPEVWKTLSPWARAQASLIVGAFDDGSPIVLTSLGAMGDIMEWFGLNTAMQLYQKWRDGQLTGKEMLAAMAKDPLNKFVQGMYPAKVGYEMLTGTSMFPDATKPRPQSRWEAAANAAGILDMMKIAERYALNNGTSFRPHSVARFFANIQDPHRNAWNESIGLVLDYKRMHGKGDDDVGGISPFKPLRESLMNRDYDAFCAALQRYLDSGRRRKNFDMSLEYLDPMGRRLSGTGDGAERDFYRNFINSDQRERVDLARKYAHDMHVLGARWWTRAFKEKRVRVNPPKK